MVRLTKEHRRQQIFDAAERIAKTFGLYDERLNFDQLCVECNCSRSTIKHHWRSLQNVRADLVKASFQGDKILFNQALEQSDPVALELTTNDSQ